MTIDLFVSCVMDQFYPETAKNVVKVLKRAGVEVCYNPEQTCCGKVAFNAGFVDKVKKMGEKFLSDFPNDRPIVGVSASCVGYIRTRYRELFHNTGSHLEYKRLVSNIYELTEFLVHKCGFVDFGASFPYKVAYHDTCASLRELGLKDEGRVLLSNVKGLELVEIKHPELCCGFGGMFSVQHEPISAALAERKFNDIMESGAEYFVTNDISCLMHLDGFAKKHDIPVRVAHIADVLSSFDAD